MIPRHNGDRAIVRPREYLSAPPAVVACTVFNYYFSHSCCAIYPLAGRTPCRVAATLTSVMSEDLAAVATWRRVPGLGRYVSQNVTASELLSRRMESVYSGESWTTYIKNSIYACWSYLPSYRKPTTSHRAMIFAQFRPRLGVDCFNNFIVPCQFFYS